MITGRVTPARIEFGKTTAPFAPDYGDVYHSRAGAFAQARHVFIEGNGLPGRWSGRRRFVVLETGFGLGNNFLATWATWRSDPARCDELCFVSVEKHPALRADLKRAHESSPEPDLASRLVADWPVPSPLPLQNAHMLEFDDGRVRLVLAFGDVAEVLPTLDVQADAIYLDGFSPALNPQMWSAGVLGTLPRLAAQGCTVATWSVARSVRDALSAGGFAVGKARGFADKHWMTVGRLER